MSFTITKKALVDAMAFLARVAEKRNTIPILSHVRMEVDGPRLTLTATDLDIEAKTTVEVEAKGRSTVTVQAHMLHDIARKIADDGKISLSWEEHGSQAVLVSGRARFKLNVLPADDYPDLSAGDMQSRFRLSAPTLALMLEKVSFAISTEETRYYLNGVYLHHTDGKLVAVATDGHRLSRMWVAAPDGAEAMPGVIIPRKTVHEIARMMKDAEQDVELEFSASKCRIILGSKTLTSKLIDGTFPDYERVIPRNNAKHMLVPREDLSKAVERVSIVSAEKSRSLRLDVKAGSLTLTMNNPDNGTAEDEVPVDYKADDITIGFNSNYLGEALNTLGGDDITFSFDTAGSPTLLTSSTHDNLTVVIMPMRV